jgi:hypothetical protein
MTSDFDKLMRQISARKEIVPQLKGLGLTFDIAASFAAPQHLYDPVRGLMGSWTDMVRGMSIAATLQDKLMSPSILGLANSLGPWMQSSANAHALSNSILNGQAALFGGLASLEAHFDHVRNPFRTWSSSFHDALADYSKHLSGETTDDEIEELDKVMNAMGAIVATSAQGEALMDPNEVSQVGQELIKVLSQLLKQLTNPQVLTFIEKLLVVLAFALAVSTELHVIEIGEELHEVHEIVDEVRSDAKAQEQILDRFIKTTESKLSVIHDTLDESIAIKRFQTNCSVHLRASPSIDGHDLGILESDQQVVEVVG